MIYEYTDLSNFRMTFNQLTNSDERFKKIFEDEYARVIFAGYRLNHMIDGVGLEKLKEHSLLIADEIKKGGLKLKCNPLKKRLMSMQFCSENDMTDEFVNYLISYLNKEKSFGYTIQPKN